jgi:adenosylmethionine-8-amino-7-oxononanoate aminotransferase
MHPLAKLDHAHVWHPFTQMKDWLRREPIVIMEGRGALLRDVQGRAYLDANSSIWTNLHGHNHPKLNAAISRQLRRIAHSSALGLANEPASRLAARLVEAANAPFTAPRRGKGEKGKGSQAPFLPFPFSPFPGPAPAPLTKVFYSDDGATAMEVALKLAYEFTRRTGRSPKPRFLSLEGAYHGDTIGAVSLGHIELFHRSYGGLTFKTDTVMAPYCYRCPFNRAQPERADAREYRRCNWECVGLVERKFASQKRRGNPYAALVVEPLIQGAAGMIPQPAGWLRRVAEIARSHGALLIADEVMTGFGRVGQAFSLPREAHCEQTRSEAEPGIGSRARSGRLEACPTLFACHQEGVQPDLMALAKGLTGGYLPMAATLTTQAVFDAFVGEYDEFKTFFHGHSYTANQLGAAAALASVEIVRSPASVRARRCLEQTLREALKSLWSLPHVGDIRQVGLVVGIELVRDWRTREPFDLRERAGIRVCEVMARRGVLTRPIGNVIVLMPPYCTTDEQAEKMVAALRESIGALRCR